MSTMSGSEEAPVLVRFDERGAHGRVAYVSVNNPARLNSLNSGVMRAVIDAVEALQHDPDLRVVVVTGAGNRAFMGGADIVELSQLDPAKATAFITLVHRISRALRALPVPVIARVNGWCLGAGLEVMAACDMRVAANNAVFGMPEVKIGLPSVVEAALLPQLIGWGRTRVLLFTGENIDATTAAEWGLVERIVPPIELDAAVEEWVAAIVESGPRAIREQKALMRRWESMGINDAIQEGVGAIARAYETDEPRRMIGAAIERMQARKRGGG